MSIYYIIYKDLLFLLGTSRMSLFLLNGENISFYRYFGSWDLNIRGHCNSWRVS